MVTKDIREKIKQDLILGLRRNADRIFNISQQTKKGFVPVDTGNLKRSGSVDYYSDGAVITYRASYAAVVEHGAEAHEEFVKGFAYTKRHAKRKGKKRKPGTTKVVVKAHIRRMPKREGVYYLARAVQEGIPMLAKDTDFFLKNHFKTRRTRV